MQSSQAQSNPRAGIIFILMAMTAISFNDMLIKFLSGGYPLHQMVFARSIIGIVFSLIIVQFEGGFHILRTSRPALHTLRCLMIVIANMTFFAALAVLPLAEATAIFFVAPLIITLLSVPVLGEKVGMLRLGAVLVGFAGVIIMTRPWIMHEGRDAPLFIYMLPILGAVAYAINQVLTRYLGVASKASALAVYIQMSFIFVSLGFWVVAGDGRYADDVTNESLIFLLRAWVWPEGRDVWLFLVLGVNSAVVGYTLAQAYRVTDAAVVAPFEYATLPLAIFWGWLIWAELPDGVTMMGIALVLGAGLFVFLREHQQKRRVLRGKRVLGR